jgi:GxxExxY protein
LRIITHNFHFVKKKIQERRRKKFRREGERVKKGNGEEKLIFEELTDRIIKSCITVHKQLGPGFIESIYHKALEIELEKQELEFETEKEYKVFYNGIEVGTHRLDLLVEDTVIVELKTVEEIHNKYYAQLRSYLKAANKPVGLLVNFADFKVDVRRVELKRQGEGNLGEMGKERSGENK